MYLVYHSQPLNSSFLQTQPWQPPRQGAMGLSPSACASGTNEAAPGSPSAHAALLETQCEQPHGHASGLSLPWPLQGVLIVTSVAIFVVLAALSLGAPQPAPWRNELLMHPGVAIPTVLGLTALFIASLPLFRRMFAQPLAWRAMTELAAPAATCAVGFLAHVCSGGTARSWMHAISLPVVLQMCNLLMLAHFLRDVITSPLRLHMVAHHTCSILVLVLNGWFISSGRSVVITAAALFEAGSVIYNLMDVLNEASQSSGMRNTKLVVLSLFTALDVTVAAVVGVYWVHQMQPTLQVIGALTTCGFVAMRQHWVLQNIRDVLSRRH